MKRHRKLAIEFARMRSDLKRARDCFGGIRLLCDRLSDKVVADSEKLDLIHALAGIRILALEAEISLGAAERKGVTALYPPAH